MYSLGGVFVIGCVAFWAHKQACIYYQKRATGALSSFTKYFMRNFIDDVCVHGCINAHHCEKLSLVLRKNFKRGGQLNPDKCHLSQTRVRLLGLMISR